MAAIKSVTLLHLLIDISKQILKSLPSTTGLFMVRQWSCFQIGERPRWLSLPHTYFITFIHKSRETARSLTLHNYSPLEFELSVIVRLTGAERVAQWCKGELFRVAGGVRLGARSPTTL